MCSMLDVHAAWSASLCCGPRGSSRKLSVTSDVGGSNSGGTNISAGMVANVADEARVPHRSHARPLWPRGSMVDVDQTRSRLEAEREETLDRLAGLTNDFDAVVAASLNSNADDEHDPEGATIAFERSQIG